MVERSRLLENIISVESEFFNELLRKAVSILFLWVFLVLT